MGNNDGLQEEDFEDMRSEIPVSGNLKKRDGISWWSPGGVEAADATL